MIDINCKRLIGGLTKLGWSKKKVQQVLPMPEFSQDSQVDSRLRKASPYLLRPVDDETARKVRLAADRMGTLDVDAPVGANDALEVYAVLVNKREVAFVPYGAEKRGAR